MKTIHKFILKLIPEQEIELPHFSRILSAQTQGINVCIWVELVPSEDKYKQKIFITGTGQEVPNEAHSYIGTTQISNGFVWHVYAGEYHGN